jgi:hypothetical protein
MTDKAIELDEHRGMAAQKATDLRRLLADVEANEAALRRRQDELGAHLIAAPAANWEEAAGGAREFTAPHMSAGFDGALDKTQLI